jgi:hypothetical protein
MRASTVPTLALALAITASGCGDRPDIYDTPLDGAPQSFALTNSVAIIDAKGNRAAILTPHAGQELERTFLPIGKGTVWAESSPDQTRLFVLSAGDVPRRKDKNEEPSLSVIENGGVRRYPLEAPHSTFSIDPQGRYVALFAAPGPTQTAFVENPNEIVIIDLQASGADAVTPRTLRSFGGRPQRVTFSQPLLLPGGPRRLLVVETDQDVHLLDLDNIRATPQRPEITVRLTSGDTAASLSPAAVVIDDGDSKKNDDARIGIRVTNSSSVFTLTLVAETPGAKPEDPNTVPNDFRPEVNLTDVGGVPGDIVFVRTDVGLRLAAIVPATRTAVLFDPTTSITSNVSLPDQYSKISLITNVVGGASGTDTALLYGSGGSRGVAFLSLGKAVGQQYRTVEVVSLSAAIADVRDIPPPRPELKVLESDSTFFVLNLSTRTASPLTTVSGRPILQVSPDGQRIWAFQKYTYQLAEITLSDLHPIPLPLDRQIDAVFDVARSDGGRALIALDNQGSGGATVLDALTPDTTTSRSYFGLLLEGL